MVEMAFLRAAISNNLEEFARFWQMKHMTTNYGLFVRWNKWRIKWEDLSLKSMATEVI